MGLMISAYAQNAFFEYLLPAETNTETEIILNRKMFGFGQDLVLKLENIEKNWFMRQTEQYYITAQKNIEVQPLEDGDILTLHDREDTQVSLIVRKTNDSFRVFHKIDITRLQTITIGCDTSNQIIYQYLSLVSRQHAYLQKTDQGLCLVDNSANGTFIDGRKAGKQEMLQIGDCINIFGLKIVYLGNMIAVSAPTESNLSINPGLPKFIPPKDEKTKEKSHFGKVKKFFHRAPRNNLKPDMEEIEIEPAPAKKEGQKKPLWMIIGPSFTMMIPMMMSSVLMVISYKTQGRQSSLFMYTGMITAGTSASIGVFWALNNIRYNKKEIRETEKARFKAYGDYLIKKSDEIREKYENTRSIMFQMYPSAATMLTYNENTPELWSRNRKHDDFLCQRVGTGNIPFQIHINVPKEKFTMAIDELNDKPRKIADEFKTLYDVPINVNLYAHKLIGVVGGERKKGAFDIVRLLTAQIAANNCYTEVKLVYIYNEQKDDENWKYCHYLPHVWSEDKKTRYVASNKSEASDILFELTQIFRMRSDDERMKKNTLPQPYYILIVSDQDMLEGELITKYIYENELCYGLTTLILEENREQLPNECEFFLQKDAGFSGIYDLSEDESTEVTFDDVSGDQIEIFARRLLSIEVKETEKGSDIPNALSFFDMMGVSTLQELNVADRWRKNRNYENMKAPIGAKAGGAIAYLDVHEKYHGPHGLVAGTTGSGKSETLQTYMLALAINFSPDDIGYFVIDYKGGGMAGLFEGLPHMIGSISNLSGNQVRRAMVSIKSENKRRQRIFSENNVNNINLYTKLYKNGEAKVPVPHMFIIIDEFAELKREEPEFMKELISVAQVGRSLGVHLILATQKPSGTVDDNIWSNSKFRLCLRVQDKQDSNDMLHKPDAAYISQAGRGYLQVGNDEVYDLFQSGYSGAIYVENADTTKTDIATMLSVTGKAALIGNTLKSKQREKALNAWIQRLMNVAMDAAAKSSQGLVEYLQDARRVPLFFEAIERAKIEYPYSDYNGHRVEDFLSVLSIVAAEEGLDMETAATKIGVLADQMRKKLPEVKNKTQLDAVIEYLGQVAKKEGYRDQMQLWMPLLPEVMYLDDLAGYSNNIFDGKNWHCNEKNWNLTLPIGFCDDPVNQAQMPLYLSFSEDGHLAVCGGIVCGKSSFLQTLLYGMIHKYSPDWINIYALDFSSKMLSCFEGAPHVGGVMYEDDTEMISKFFHMIEVIIDERKKMFRGGNYSQYVQVNGVKVPAIIIAIDNVGAFREKTDGKYDDKLIRLSKEGVGYGIYLALSGGNFSNAEIPNKVANNIKTAVCLQMTDKYAYQDVLRKNHIDTLPESNIKGRGLALVGEVALEYQTALALEADNDFDRIEKIKAICKKMANAWQGPFAREIPVIPEKPIWSEYEKLGSVSMAQADPQKLPLGYDLSSADVYSVDLAKTFIYMVSGKARTGKTNVMKTIIRSAAKKPNAKVVVIEHGASDLKPTADAVGAQYIDNVKDQAQFFQDLLPEFKRRNVIKRELITAGKEEIEIFEEQAKSDPYFIIFSDIVTFVQSVQKKTEGVMDIKPFLENIADKGKFHNIFFFGTINQDQLSSLLGIKLYEGLVSYKTGMHLGGSITNMRYMDFSNFSFVEQGKPQKPGLAMLPAGNEDSVAKVVIPLVKG